MKRSRFLVILSICLVFIGFFLWALISPKTDLEETVAQKIKAEKEKSDVLFKNVTFSEISDGIKYWELNAVSSTVNKSIGVANLKTVDGLFFNNGKTALKFIAPKAAWKINDKEIYLNEPLGYDTRFEKDIQKEIKKLGGIQKFLSYFYLPSEKASSKSKGYWFKAKNLDWKLATKTLNCIGSITLSKGDMTIKAKRLEADVSLEKVKLSDNPNAMLYIEKDKSEVNIKANTFLVDSKADKIYANDKVSIKSGSASIFSKNAVYDQKNKVINLTGGVNLSTKDITAWGDKAVYSTSDYTAELSGNAHAKRGGSELRGEKIIVLTKENRLIIIGRSKATIRELEIKSPDK